MRFAGAALALTFVAACASPENGQAPVEIANLCASQSQLPEDFALREEMFTLDAALAGLESLETNTGGALNEIFVTAQERPNEAAARVNQAWETLNIGRGNDLIALRGYLLRQRALAAEPSARAAAVADYCRFVTQTPAVD